MVGSRRVACSSSPFECSNAASALESFEDHAPLVPAFASIFFRVASLCGTTATNTNVIQTSRGTRFGAVAHDARFPAARARSPKVPNER